MRSKIVGTLFVVSLFCYNTCKLPPKSLEGFPDIGLEPDTIQDNIVDQTNIDSSDTFDSLLDSPSRDVTDASNSEDSSHDINLCEDVFCLPDETCNPNTGQCEKEGLNCMEIYQCMLDNGYFAIFTCISEGSAEGRREFGALLQCLTTNCLRELISGDQDLIMNCTMTYCMQEAMACYF